MFLTLISPPRSASSSSWALGFLKGALLVKPSQCQSSCRAVPDPLGAVLKPPHTLSQTGTSGEDAVTLCFCSQLCDCCLAAQISTQCGNAIQIVFVWRVCVVSWSVSCYTVMRSPNFKVTEWCLCTSPCAWAHSWLSLGRPANLQALMPWFLEGLY